MMFQQVSTSVTRYVPLPQSCHVYPLVNAAAASSAPPTRPAADPRAASASAALPAAPGYRQQAAVKGAAARMLRGPAPDRNLLCLGRWQFRQAASRSGAAQEHYGAARRSPTHPSVDIARPGRAAGPRAPGATS